MPRSCLMVFFQQHYSELDLETSLSPHFLLQLSRNLAQQVRTVNKFILTASAFVITWIISPLPFLSLVELNLLLSLTTFLLDAESSKLKVNHRQWRGERKQRYLKLANCRNATLSALVFASSMLQTLKRWHYIVLHLFPVLTPRVLPIYCAADSSLIVTIFIT